MTRIPLRRYTARVLPVDSQGRVLLLHGFDPLHPEVTYWFTIGGAAEGAETLQEAAVRELREEVGIVASAGDFTGPLETSTIEFAFAEYDIVQDQTFFGVEVGDAEVSFEHMEEIEKVTTIEYRWWSVADLETTTEVVFPANLPILLRKAGGKSGGTG